MWNDGSSKIKGPSAEVLFLDLKWLFNMLMALSNATFFHLLSQTPAPLYLLYLIQGSRIQGAVLLALCLLVCLTAYWLICLLAYLHLELYLFKTASFVCIIIHSKNTSFAQQCAGPFGFCNILHSFKHGLQSSLFMCSHLLLFNLITCCFLICFSQETQLYVPCYFPHSSSNTYHLWGTVENETVGALV